MMTIKFEVLLIENGRAQYLDNSFYLLLSLQGVPLTSYRKCNIVSSTACSLTFSKSLRPSLAANLLNNGVERFRHYSCFVNMYYRGIFPRKDLGMT